MPFGHDCEHETFDDCLADQKDQGHDEESARRICGALQRDTEDKCKASRRPTAEQLAMLRRRRERTAE